MKLPKSPDSTNDSNMPKSKWDKIVTSTPVVMTILATLLAGLSSSESNQAQYYRSLSAQNQSKAGDQWSFFQAKKLLAATHTDNVKGMRNLGDMTTLTPESFAVVAAHLHQHFSSGSNNVEKAHAIQEQIIPLLTEPDIKKAIEMLTTPLPPLGALKISDAKVRDAYEILKRNQGDDAPRSTFGGVDAGALQEALKVAGRNVQASDDELQPVKIGIARLERLLNQLANISRAASQSTTQHAPGFSFAATDREIPGEVRQLAADFTVAELRFDAARQDREAKLNQQSAYLYEVAVRKTSWQSDRSLIRSRYFFYGMLGAQAAVLIATFSLAVRERSWMWSIAASIGVMAMAYAGYVYLYT